MNRIERRKFLKQTACGTLAAMAMQSLGPQHAAAAGATGRIKIGQIGVGHAHASGKMDALRRHADHFEVVGVVEPDAQRRAMCEKLPAYRGLTWMTEQQLLATQGLQAVAVETTVADLVPTAQRCIEAGMHLHLDKPAGESLQAFRKLLDAATRRGLTVQMGYMFRNNPAFQFCFRAVREGWLGQITEVHGVISSLYNAEQRKPLAPYRGGIMFELGGHLIDPLVTVLGKPERVTPYIRRLRPQWDDVADNQLAVFEYAKAMATVRSSLLEVSSGQRRQFVVCGDEGTVDIRPLEPPRLQLALSRPRDAYHRGYQEITLPAMPGRYDDQLLELAAIIRGEKPNAYSPAHDLAVEETLLQAAGLPIAS